jgi:hypothetical protein
VAVTAPSYTQHIRPLDRVGSHQLAVFRAVRFTVMKQYNFTKNKRSLFITHIYCIYCTCFAVTFTVIIRENSVMGTKVVAGDGDCNSEIKQSNYRPGQALCVPGMTFSLNGTLKISRMYLKPF